MYYFVYVAWGIEWQIPKYHLLHLDEFAKVVVRFDSDGDTLQELSFFDPSAVVVAQLMTKRRMYQAVLSNPHR